jgi:hypothetical protein
MPHWFALPSATENQRRYIVTTNPGAALLALGSALGGLFVTRR